MQRQLQELSAFVTAWTKFEFEVFLNTTFSYLSMIFVCKMFELLILKHQTGPQVNCGFSI